MSVIRKKPFIETLVEGLSATNKALLLEVMNTPGDNEKVSFDDLPDKGITPVYFQLDEQNFKTGILIYTDDICVLIAHHRFQDLLILELNVANKTYEKINEYCDINELRRIVDVTIDSISSGDAEENTILAADGEGGSSWVKPAETIKDADVEAGNAQTILAFDEEGNVVKSAVPTGTVTVDGALSEVSENPVQNKVITAELEDKADKDGDYPLMSVGEADVAESAKQLLSTLYVNDKVPYSLRTSGGSADIGDRLYDKNIGGTLVWNQYAKPFDDVSWGVGDAIKNVVDNVLTITGTQRYWLMRQDAPLVSGHKYLCSFDVKMTTPNPDIQFGLGSSSNFASEGVFKNLNNISNTDWNTISFIGTYNKIGDSSTYIIFMDTRASGWDAFSVRNLKVHDLTAMFGSTIADYLAGLSNNGGINWFNNYFKKDIYAYDAGSLQSVQVSSHKMIGFNAYNNATGKAQLLGGHQYQITGTYTSISYSTGETLTPDVNGKFTPTLDGELTVVGGNATDTCIHLVWSGSRDGEFEPYEENAYTLDSTKVLRGVPKLDVNNKLYYDGDEYLSEGKVIRKFGVVDLGSLEWTYLGAETDNARFTASLTGMKSVVNDDTKFNGICSRFSIGTGNGVYTHSSDKIIGKYSGGSTLIGVYDSSYTDATAFKTAMSGVMLVYELETLTEETATPFTNPQVVNDFGTEEYVDAGTRDFTMPVGHDTNYLQNLRDKLQRLPDAPTNTGVYVVNYADSVCTYVALSTWLTENNYKANVIPDAPTTDGDYTLKVSIIDGVATYSWEEI